MSSPRREFLQKSSLGLLSLSLVPSFIHLWIESEERISPASLFGKFAFRKIDTLMGKNPTGNMRQAFSSGRTILTAQEHLISPGRMEQTFEVHQKTTSGYTKVLSFNELETFALNKITHYLKTDHNVQDPTELRKWLIPVLKTPFHRTGRHFIGSESISKYGYYTDAGYCSLQILVKGKRPSVKATLRNLQGTTRFNRSFEIQHFI